MKMDIPAKISMNVLWTILFVVPAASVLTLRDHTDVAVSLDSGRVEAVVLILMSVVRILHFVPMCVQTLLGVMSVPVTVVTS